MSAQHTPTPWHRAPVTFSVVDAKGYLIASLADRGDDENAVALNSAFIVRACNSHEALVEALKACMIRLVQVDERFRAHTGAEPAGELGEITRAKAALKLLDD